LETCETTNGPVREGQNVRIEFTDGGWETQFDAQRAPQIDPGRVKINTDTYRTSSSDAFQAAPERWYRHFYIHWRAEAGTYRVVGERLTYVVTCDLTVPVG